MIPNRRDMRRGYGRIILATACVIAALAAPSRAQGPRVVLVVNGEVITEYDIEQRSKFLTLSTHKSVPKQEVIEDLIDEKLKVQVARGYKFEVPDSDVDSSFAEMGRRMHLSPDQLVQTLAQSGVDAQTLKSKIRADITWQYIIRGKFQSSLQINEKSILKEMENQNKTDTGGQVGYDYTLRPILFIVPKGNTPILEAHKKDAEMLRARFTDCSTGLPFARSLRDIAIRESITKSSSELVPALREILDKTEIGHLTAPEVTEQGVELFALCERKETKVDSPDKKAAQQKLFSDTFEAKAKGLLRDLRRKAMIERKS